MSAILSALFVTSNGTLVNDVHPSNILANNSTLLVFSKGMVVRFEQFMNISDILVTTGVLNSGMLVSAVHPLNILSINITLEVSNSGTVFRDEQFMNISDI